MKRLGHDEAQLLLNKTYQDLAEHPSLRFGQALYNNLPKDIAAEINNGPNDFFYEKDLNKVMDMFIVGCCEVDL